MVIWKRLKNKLQLFSHTQGDWGVSCMYKFWDTAVSDSEFPISEKTAKNSVTFVLVNYMSSTHAESYDKMG